MGNTLVTINSLQHAYQRTNQPKQPYSLAISIEKALNQTELSIGASLDIQRAFDNDNIHILHLSRRTVFRWIRSILFNREVTVKLNEASVRATVGRGHPQGKHSLFPPVVPGARQASTQTQREESV